MTHHSYNEFHLGDNLIHLHFLRKLALHYPEERFVHAVHPCHLAPLAEVVEDVGSVRLIPLEEKAAGSVNVWKNAGATVTDGTANPGGRYVPGYWEQHRFRNNFAWFYIEWFKQLAGGMGLESPIQNYRDLWFDYPKLAKYSLRVAQVLDAVHGREAVAGRDYPIGACGPRFDFLVVNSRPGSGQFRAYDSTEYLTPLIAELAARHRVVVTQPLFIDGRARTKDEDELKARTVCTMDHGLTVSEIGTLSLHADHLVMVSTGPSWPTFNVWNADAVKLRLLLLDCPEKIDYAPNLVQVASREQARQVLEARGLL